MIYHILNGDAIAAQFPDDLDGISIVIREAFVEGPVSTQFSDDFWEERLAFININYQAEREDYEEQFLSQLEILDQINPEDRVYLWFEDDLFCLVNMLFVIAYVSEKTQTQLFRVFPVADNQLWKGFGSADEKELKNSFQNSIQLDEEDVELAKQLWEAYGKNDREKLQLLSHSHSDAFRFLPEVIHAQMQRNPSDGGLGRPQLTLVEILKHGRTNFYEIYEDFWRKEAIYGFGDMQVFNMLKEMQIEFTGEPGD